MSSLDRVTTGGNNKYGTDNESWYKDGSWSSEESGLQDGKDNVKGLKKYKSKIINSAKRDCQSFERVFREMEVQKRRFKMEDLEYWHSLFQNWDQKLKELNLRVEGKWDSMHFDKNLCEADNRKRKDNYKKTLDTLKWRVEVNLEFLVKKLDEHFKRPVNLERTHKGHGSENDKFVNRFRSGLVGPQEERYYHKRYDDRGGRSQMIAKEAPILRNRSTSANSDNYVDYRLKTRSDGNVVHLNKTDLENLFNEILDKKLASFSKSKNKVYRSKSHSSERSREFDKEMKNKKRLDYSVKKFEISESGTRKIESCGNGSESKDIEQIICDQVQEAFERLNFKRKEDVDHNSDFDVESSWFQHEILRRKKIGIKASDHYKRPKLIIPPFDGTISMFEAFRNMFFESVHCAQDMSDQAKMLTLYSLVTGEAADVISGIPLDGEHYLMALKLLEKRFGMPKEWMNKMLKDLRKLEREGNSKDQVRNLCDNIRKFALQISRKHPENLNNKIMKDELVEKFPIALQMKVLVKQAEKKANWNYLQLLKECEKAMDIIPEVSWKFHVEMEGDMLEGKKDIVNNN